MAHYHFGYLFNPTRGCTSVQPPYEAISNYSFDCGCDGWGYDETYKAKVTCPVKGEVHLLSESDFGSVVPNELPNTDDGQSWTARCMVKNLTNNGKMSVRLGGIWHNVPFDRGSGIYEYKFTGNITEFHCGADGVTGATMDFEFISLRHSIDPGVEYIIPIYEFEEDLLNG